MFGKSLGCGLVVTMFCGWVSAQDGPERSLLQDLQQRELIEKQLKALLEKTQPDTGTRQRQVEDQQIEAARKVLEQLIKAQKAKQDAEAAKKAGEEKKVEIQRKSFKIVVGPDGKAQIIAEPDGKKPAAGSVDQKLDLILKQLAELRKDVDGIKKNLDGKKPDVIQWQMKPGTKPNKDGIIELEIVPPGKDRKPGTTDPKIGPPPVKDKRVIDDEVRKRLDDIIRKLEAEQKSKGPIPGSQKDLEDELRRAEERLRDLEALLRKLEAQQREKQNKKAPPR